MRSFLLSVLLIISFPLEMIHSQILSPPYKIIDKNFESFYTQTILKEYYADFDSDGDGKKDFFIYTHLNNKDVIQFYKSNFNLCDEYHTKGIGDKFITPIPIIKIHRKDFLLLGYARKNKLYLQLIDFQKDCGYEIHDIYEQNVNNKSSHYYLNGKVINDSLLLIVINTIYPQKHDYRRILAFDANNLKLLWEIKTADFVSCFSYSKLTPGYFYYTTFAYLNGLFLSHNTFYRMVQIGSKYKTQIDTCFGKCAPLEPDSTAEDYSTDTYSYIVKCSLKGKVISRKKIGLSFEHVSNLSPVLGDSLFFMRFNSRSHKKKGIFLYEPISGNLDTLVLTDDLSKNYFVFNNKFYYQTFDIDKKLIFRKVQINDKFSRLLKQLPKNFLYSTDFLPYLKHKLFFFAPNHIYVTNDSLDLLSVFPNKNERYGWGGYSDYAKSFYLVDRKNNNRKFIDFYKLSIPQRISEKTKNYIIIFLFIALMAVIILWLVSLKKNLKVLKKRNTELKESRAELENTTAKLIHTEKLALLGTVAASFAHQLNSPLGAIINSARRLEEKINDENLDLIIRSAEYSKSMVSKFLFASKPDAETESKCIDIKEIWTSWLSIFKSEFINHGIEIVDNLEPISGRIKIKRSEILEILSNLLFNARDAILESENEQKQISVYILENQNNIIISITDSGIGLTEEQIEKIFTPFYTSKPVGMGTGLGLWITKNLIQKANGEITVINNKNGATFSVVLPKC